MTDTTARGDKLAMLLNPYIGTTWQIRETCALIARHARTHNNIQERWCNDEMSDRATARLEARETALEARITDLVAQLPDTDDGPWKVEFQGDPRGYTVKLVTPTTGREIGADV